MSGCRSQIKANNFILCTGAIDNCRVLLNSKTDNYAQGLGNASGLLGKYLLDHLCVRNLCLFSSLLFKKINSDGYGNHLIVPSFFRSKEIKGTFLGDFYHGNKQLLPSFLTFSPGIFPEFLKKRLLNTLGCLVFFGTPEPLESNRIVSSQEVDQFGIPKVDIVYNHSENDRKLIAEMKKIGSEIMGLCGTFVESDVGKPGSSIHVSGGCRMSKSMKNGIVDKNLQSHTPSKLVYL